MKKKTVLFYVFDGFADWEGSYAMTGIAKSGLYELKTIAIEKRPIRSMGGMVIMPDLDFIAATDLKDISFFNTAMLILPGGTAWEAGNQQGIRPLIEHCIEHQICVAAICGATIMLSEIGLLNNRIHTSNAQEYLESFSPSYNGAFYRNWPSVNGGGLITANGTAGIEFAADIFDELMIMEEMEVASWFRYFQNKPVTFKQFDPGLVAG